MASAVSESRNGCSLSFQKIVDVFLGSENLPFANLLSAERIKRVFHKHGCLFGIHGVYSTAIVVWSFLSQVLRDGKEASCQAAVARIVSYCNSHGFAAPTRDTGDYCRARAKLSAPALKELACEVAKELEDGVDPEWLWKSKYHVKVVDGSTLTMPDTAKNQAAYPQQRCQKPGVGFPIARFAVVVSLATACVMDLAIAPFRGKETGESALLRTMLKSFCAGDIAVMDRYNCSFMMLALLLGQGTQVCARKHHLRHSDFRRGKRLGKYDHLIVWTRPTRPAWMDEETYRQIPEKLELREIRFSVVVPGRRTKSIDIITTLTDASEHSKEDIAELYGFRWNTELDIRSSKSNLNLGHVRCKSPEMVQRELWATMLGYNLVRSTAAAAALLHRKTPRTISFTATCQYILASWMQLSSKMIATTKLDEYRNAILEQIAACQVGNRPGRLEPRVLKRRRDNAYDLMMKPRNVLRQELRKLCT
ncbi:MAG: IS4 family transposase [Pirellulaceae bacterium]